MTKLYFFLTAAYDLGGVICNSRKDADIINKNRKPGMLKEMNW